MVQFCKTEASKGFSSLPSNEDQRKVWFDVCQIATTKLINTTFYTYILMMKILCIHLKEKMRD